MTNPILSLDSFKEVVIYGYSKVGLDDLRDVAKKAIGSSRYVYDWSTPYPSFIQCDTLSGRGFIELPQGLSQSAQCKNALVAFVVENYLRKKEGTSIIPVVFGLSSTNCPALPTASIANKKIDTSGQGAISNAELRRIYKLSNDPELSFEIKEIAKETFKFVHLILPDPQKGCDSPILQEISSPWENESQIWIEARELKKSGEIKLHTNSSKLNWRSLLVDPIKVRKMGTIPKGISTENLPPSSSSGLMALEDSSMKKTSEEMIDLSAIDAAKINLKTAEKTRAQAIKITAGVVVVGVSTVLLYKYSRR